MRPELPDESHVVRYAAPRHIHDDGSVDGYIFRLRPQESGLSVHWLEYFSHLTKPQQLEEIRRLSRLNLRRNGRLAELSVGLTRQELPDLAFLSQPLAATAQYPADPSHSEIAGLPPGDSPQAALIGDLMAGLVQNLHPALGEG